MKKIWLLVATIAIISCKQETPVDYALVSGKITNLQGKKITINGKDRSLKATLEVAEDGSFSDTLRLEEGSYFLVYGRNGTVIQLNDGANIKVTFDAKDFQNSIVFTGSDVSNYYVAKQKKYNEVVGQGPAVYELEEEAFKGKFNQFKTEATALIDTYKEIDNDFKAKELRNLNYAYLQQLSIYPRYHAHYAKKPDFKASEGFASELDAVTFDNEEDFDFSPDYAKMVSNHYREKASKIVENDKVDYSLAFLNAIAEVQSAKIKNSLAFGAAQNEITYAEDLKAYYDAYMALSTDEKNNEIITKSYNDLLKVAKGQPSPKFVNFENYNGGTTSLDDLKGKYVYVDVWATWCGPCKAEIPFLKEVEKKYHGKNIEFVSLSVDKAADHDKWKAMIAEKEMGGIQLFADKDWNSDFVKGYLIKGIPRFILIDTEGNIISANAPRPSNKELINLFDEYKI